MPLDCSQCLLMLLHASGSKFKKISCLTVRFNHKLFSSFPNTGLAAIIHTCKIFLLRRCLLSIPLLISTGFLKYPFWHLFQTGIKFQYKLTDFFFSDHWNSFSVPMDISKSQWRSTGGMSVNVCQCLSMSADVCLCHMVSVDVCSCLWMSVDVCGCLWMSVDVVDVCGCLMMSADVCGCLWLSVAVCGCLLMSVGVWMSVDVCGCL